MKNNVITSQFSIPFETDGELRIIGTSTGKVLFMVRGSCGSYLSQIYQREIMENWVFAWSVEKHEPIFFFEYSLRGELRNPQRLLKSVRNKLMAAVIEARIEAENEHHEKYGGSFPTDHCV